MAMYIALNGTPIKSPTSLGFEHYNLTKSGRVASGKMTMDIVAKKRKFLLSYDIISHADYQVIMNVIDSNQAFFNFGYEQNGVRKSAVVYAGAPKWDRFRTDKGAWYYKNFSFDLIEQ